jgi:hypothetical protein
MPFGGGLAPLVLDEGGALADGTADGVGPPQLGLTTLLSLGAAPWDGG